jgi:hypothetical protein
MTHPRDEDTGEDIRDEETLRDRSEHVNDNGMSDANNQGNVVLLQRISKNFNSTYHSCLQCTRLVLPATIRLYAISVEYYLRSTLYVFHGSSSSSPSRRRWQSGCRKQHAGTGKRLGNAAD